MGRIVCNSIRRRFVDWQLDELLAMYPGLRLVPTSDEYVKVAGAFAFVAQARGTERIEDEYQIEIVIPYTFPRRLPSVFETANRIPKSFHNMSDGSLCLGSPTRQRLLVSPSSSVLRFVKRCVIPYLYGRSYFEKHQTMPFGELKHGQAGIRDDLAVLFGIDNEDAIKAFVHVAAMRKRQANKQGCPCGSHQRLARCHHRRVNDLRSRLGRYWFRELKALLAPHG